jgi:hypothetical protein
MICRTAAESARAAPDEANAATQHAAIKVEDRAAIVYPDMARRTWFCSRAFPTAA